MCGSATLRAWFSGGHGSAGLAIGLRDFRGLLQPKYFYDSISSAPPGIRPPVLLLLPGTGTAITHVTSTPGDMPEAMGIGLWPEHPLSFSMALLPSSLAARLAQPVPPLQLSFKLWLNLDNFGYEL